MEKKRVLVADPIAEAGIATLQDDPSLEVDVRLGISKEDLLKDAGLYDAIVVRSQTKIGADVLAKASRLQVVGRAGVGVDNIDIEAATAKGVIVMNTPGGNTTSTAEHAFTLMLSLARHIPQAHASILEGKWERKKYQGVEIHNKTLLIIGMGRIGSEFARRAMAFGMRVIAYDPYLSANRARLLRVELANDLDAVLPEADFITLHMPLTPETHHIINQERLQMLKPEVRIVNCARGGLVDEAALDEALKAGRIAGAALDVYEEEPPPSDYPLLKSEQVVLTPHLGASTTEAQENVGIEIAQSILRHLQDGTVVNAVNMPSIDPQTLAQIGPYLQFAEALGTLAAAIAPAQSERFRVEYSGKISEVDTTLITRAALKGFLKRAFDEQTVNYLNAPNSAKVLGLQVTESKKPDPSEYTDLIELRVTTGETHATVAGTFFGGSPRVVKVNQHNVEIQAEGVILMLENKDTPGIVGQVGSLLGKHKVNIAQMALSRNAPGGTALMVVNLDSPPPEAVMEEFGALDTILNAHFVDLPLPQTQSK